MNVFEGSNVYYFCSESDLKGKYLYASNNFLNVDGHNLEEMLEMYTKSIRDKDVPQYVLDEMYDWPRSKGFWEGVLKNVRKDGTTYWVKSSIIRLRKDNQDYFGMISQPASKDEIEKTTQEYEKLKSYKYDPTVGRKLLRYPLYKDNLKHNHR